MRLFSRFSTLAVLGCGLISSATFVHADVFDWNNFTYAPANAAAAANQTRVGNSTNGGNSLDVQLVLSTGSSFITPPASPASGSYSTSTTYASGGGADTQRSLQIGTNFSNNAATTVNGVTTYSAFATVTLFFAQPVVSVSFNFFDVDSNAAGTFVDQIRNIQGINSNTGAQVAPTSLTATAGASATVTTLGTQTATGKSGVASAQNAALGNVSVQFDSTTPLSQLSFVYGDIYVGTTGSPHATTQVIALSNINFTNAVPEPGTVAMLGLGVFGAAGVAFRRRKK